MKKLVLLPLLLFALFSLQAKNLSEYDYVVTKNGTFYCQHINVGLLHIKGIQQNGEALKIKLNDVTAFKSNGRIFERLQVYQDNRATNSFAFMELIAMNDGVKLFRYNDPENTTSLGSLFIYQNGEYVLQVSDKSSTQVFKFFNLNLS